jgi:hypothetical protein
VTSNATATFLREIARGPLWRNFQSSLETSISLDVELCSLNGVFIPKGRVGRHHRAISRNGLIILMSPRLLADYQSTLVQLQLAIWHRTTLKGELPKPWGILLCIRDPRVLPDGARTQSLLKATLDSTSHSAARLSLDLGGERFINFV